MFGPVRMTMRVSWSSARSFGVTGLPVRASSTGWRPSTIVSAGPSSTIGRTWPRLSATSASEAKTSSRASARAVVMRLPALVSAERLHLVLLELRGHVALRAGERLAAHVLGGHARGLGVSHLDAIAEHPIEADP